MTYKIYVDGKLFCDSNIDELAVINPVIKNEINKAGSFNFSVPADHYYTSLIKPMQSLVAVHMFVGDREDIVFFGICTTVVENMFGEKSVSCEGALAINNRTYCTRISTSLTSVSTVFQLFISSASYYIGSNYIALNYGTCNVTTPTYNPKLVLPDIVTNLNAIMELIRMCGGYIQIRDIVPTVSETSMRYVAKIDYLKELPSECNQELLVGKNLISLDVDADAPDVFTVVVPMGDRYEDSNGTIKRYVGTKHEITALKNKYGSIEKQVIYEGITGTSALTRLGEVYAEQNIYTTLKMRAKFLDLSYQNPEYDTIKPGHVVHVYSEKQGVDQNMKVISRTYNLNAPQNDTVELGFTSSIT